MMKKIKKPYLAPKTKHAVRESPVEWLAKRKMPDGTPYLDKQELNAADQLYRDFEGTQTHGSFGQNWDRFLDQVYCRNASRIETARVHAIDRTASAKDRFKGAVSYLGYGLSSVVVKAICQLHTLETIEKDMQWPARSGKAILKIALYQLSVFYGLRKNDQNAGKINVWRGY